MKFALSLVLILFIPTLSFAAQNSFNLTFSSGKNLENVAIKCMDGDSLEITHAGTVQWIKIDSLVTIKQIKDSNFWKGAGYGFFSGAVLGAILGGTSSGGSDNSGEFDLDFEGPGWIILSGVIVGTAGATVGGVIGALDGTDKVYDLSNKNLDEKKKIINSILSKSK